ncbi:MAG: cyclic pyranopterin monophosphate synthase MoaC [Clostridium sp.]|nr:cyclic pyranopterin monophosphate synthase MoaC [Clostridium sp.]
MEEKLTHFDAKGNAIMVDVTEKNITHRTAVASGKIRVNESVMKAVLEGTVAKGDVLGVARVAGIMAAKRTWELIPMCHPLMLTKCTIDFKIDEKACMVEATCLVRVSGQTGVEMEALTGVNVALLTIYDMCKAIDKGMVISDIKLLEKQGGKSGHYIRSEKQCVFAVSGIKNSGKTTLTTKLVNALTLIWNLKRVL